MITIDAKNRIKSFHMLKMTKKYAEYSIRRKAYAENWSHCLGS